MSEGIKLALKVIIMVIGATIFYRFIKGFIFSIVKPKKIVAGIIPVLVFILTSFVGARYGAETNVAYYVLLFIFMISLFYFMDVMGWSAPKESATISKEKNQVIKSKAKPNRVKNLKK